MNSKSISNYFLISLIIAIVALSTAVVIGVNSSKNLNSENVKIYQEKIEKQTKELSECKKESDTLRQELKTNQNYISVLLKLIPDRINKNNITSGGKPIGNTEILSKLLGMISRLQQNNETLLGMISRLQQNNETLLEIKSRLQQNNEPPFEPVVKSELARIRDANREHLSSISVLQNSNREHLSSIYLLQNSNREYLNSISLLIKESIADSQKGR
jgi:translation initiation factor RLI1